jgi:CBS domain-containing protein/PII-like signaling protein
MRRWLVRDVMTSDVRIVGPDTGYKEIVEIMFHNAVSAVPVIDDGGQVVGVVSELDLLHKLEFAGLEPHVRIFERKRQRVARAKSAADTAEALMTSPAIVIAADASLIAAATLMDHKGLKRLPVVDSAGVLVGIVSRGDLLRAYLRSDEEILKEVRQDVLRRAMWLEPGQVTASVAQGIVTLTGRTDRRTTAQITVQLVQALPGVVDVVDELTFRYDDTAELKRSQIFGATVKETVP